jgi:hypothetical protein
MKPNPIPRKLHITSLHASRLGFTLAQDMQRCQDVVWEMKNFVTLKVSRVRRGKSKEVNEG